VDFCIAGLLAFIGALLTVSWQSWKASLMSGIVDKLLCNFYIF